MRSIQTGEVGQASAERMAARLARHVPYYEKYDRAHDDLMRCFDCNRLVVYQDVMNNQGTTLCCGQRKLREVRALKFREWLMIRLGIIDFPYRLEFLKEFGFPLFGFYVRPVQDEQMVVDTYVVKDEKGGANELVQQDQAR